MIRFATIGTNFVVDWFLQAMQQCQEEGKKLQFTAAYSREEEKGRAFADKYNVGKVYTSLTELAADKEIDAVYIASPNSFHYQQAAIMLNHGKHVLCEKTITSNSQELMELCRLAKANQVVLMEAMRSVFDPGFQVICENLPKLGPVRRAVFSYCQYSSRYDKFKAGIVENAFNPYFSNGALMDIGVYCVHPAVKLFGLPEKVSAGTVFLANGVDGAGTALLQYQDKLVELQYSKITDGHLPSQIQGELGTMEISTITNPHNISVQYRNGSRESLYDIPLELNNMVHEIRAFSEIAEAGRWNHPHLQHSVAELRVMDQIRQTVGIRFPADQTEHKQL